MMVIVVEDRKLVKAINALRKAGVASYIPADMLDGFPYGIAGPFRTLDEVECWWEDK